MFAELMASPVCLKPYIFKELISMAEKFLTVSFWWAFPCSLAKYRGE